MKKKILSGILIITMMATCAFAGAACSSEKGQSEPLNIGTEQAYTDSNMQFNESENNGINLMSTVIPTNEYATYGVTAQAEVAYTLTATVNPSSATNKEVDWGIAWMDASSTFATGKTVTDYVTVVPSYDGSVIATVTCYQAFEGEILVAVTTREGGFQADCIVTFSGSVTILGAGVFRSCTSLTKVIIGNGITSINPNTFYGCSKLASISISKNLTIIGSYAFYNCFALDHVYYSGTSSDRSRMSIGSYNVYFI